jgi:hypothetical protein
MCSCLLIIPGNQVHCVVSFVFMESIIEPNVPRLLECCAFCYVSFFIVMIECVLSQSCSSYSEAYCINGLNVNVYATSFNDIKKC